MNVKADPFWRKAKIGARIILRSRAGKLRPHDHRVAAVLAADLGVTDRLLDQALACMAATKEHYDNNASNVEAGNSLGFAGGHNT